MPARSHKKAAPPDQDEAIPPINDLENAPDTPLEIPPAGWKNTYKRAGKKFSLDRCTMAAGSLVPFDLTVHGLVVRSGQTISMTVQNVNLTPTGTQVFGFLGGYYWPLQ